MVQAPSIIISHWFNTIENFQASPMQFYASVEEAIKRRQIPFSSTERVEWHEGGIFSAQREYLRITRNDHIFDICGAPYGTGFFVSWWFGERKAINPFMAVAIFLGFMFALWITFS